MTVTALFEKCVRYDRAGKPLEVVVPYEDMLNFIEEHGFDISPQDRVEIFEAMAQSDAGNREGFVTSEEIEQEFECIR